MIWNGCGRPESVVRDGYPVQHQRLCRERAHRGDDLRQRIGDLIQSPGIKAHAPAFLVRLHPRAVQLPLHGNLPAPNSSQRCIHVRRRLRQHRRHRREQLQLKPAESRRALGHGDQSNSSPETRHTWRAVVRPRPEKPDAAAIASIITPASAP